ncbi:hypothetical protein DRW03_26160 [Corallococcus sp. H22C18031201]|uniref:hypothetical protein n=1 Tax=Citreicoccus inhibens TaxID=2849499 RepID=UPI000E7366DB|nr:hypothetical protein [Citreicoccus inhibens]MBU8898160.1 hypothetical protein [Citreicoccus inhibens]RJS18043.1 hypothetical protein DRW03_26160 [Corallococcus sp. H22C18031201]
MPGIMRPSCLLLLSLMLASPVFAASGDDWFGSDKPRHFGACLAFTGAGYGAGALLFDEPSARWLTGAGAGLGAGVGKELYDLARGKTFSLKDLAWDTAGTATGLLASFLVDQVVTALSRPAEPARAPGVVAVRSGRARGPLAVLDAQLAALPRSPSVARAGGPAGSASVSAVPRAAGPAAWRDAPLRVP